MEVSAAPNLTINVPLNNSYLVTNNTWLNVTTDENANCTYYLVTCTVSGNVGSCGGTSPKTMNITGTVSHSQTIPNLQDTVSNQEYNLYANCTNSVGISRESFTKFYIDTTFPSIKAYSHLNGTVINGKNPLVLQVNYTEINLNVTSLHWKESGNTSYNKVNLTGCISGTNKQCSQTVNLSQYADGIKINYYFNLTDVVNHSSTLFNSDGSPYTLIIDNTPPSVTKMVLNDSDNKVRSSDSLKINVTVTDINNVANVTINASLMSQSGSIWSISKTPSQLNCPSDGTCILGFTATDTAGNVNGSEILTITIDSTAPTSSINALQLYLNVASFNVSWVGNDGTGTGILNYDIEVSDNNGDWTIWQDDTTESSAIYNGAEGHTYRFRSKAKDVVSHMETKTTPDTNITIDTTKPPIVLSSLSNNSVQEVGTIINLTISDATPISFVWYFNGSINTTIASPYDISTSNWVKAEYILTVYANDSAANLNSEVYKFIFDNRPNITTSAVTSTLEDELYYYDVNATDADGDTLAYSLVTNPSGMTISSTNGTLNWIPDNSKVGNHNVIVRVTDGNLSTNQSFALTVINVNDPPNLTLLLPDVKFDEDSYNDTLNLSMFFSDVDNATLIYSSQVNDTNVQVTIYPNNTIKINSSLMEWACKCNYHCE